ncbi:hypothetical protein [Actinomadura miaoliensis]|uniref:Uncharacterized protein n=1 Tax=Actinomadura miaoliensis TaxID=430685 RepID=A0ABP7W6A1_9ACTN
MAFRLWATIALTLSQADGWRTLAAAHEQKSAEEAALGQVREAARHEGRAEAYKTAASVVEDVVSGLGPYWGHYMRWDERPRRWRWALRVLLDRVTR